MRIAFCLGRFPSVSETFILSQITGLLDRGHEVDLFAWPQRTPQPFDQPAVAEYGLMDRVTFWPRMPAGTVAKLARGAALAAGGVRSPATTARSLDARRFGRSALSLDLLNAGASLRDRGPYDIVHAHFGPNAVKAADLIAVGAFRGTRGRPKLLASFYGFDLGTTLRKFGDRYYDRLFRTADALLPLSDFFARRLTDLGCPPEKIHVHRLGVDVAQFAFRPRRRDPSRPVRLASVARLVRKKGIEDGVEALAEVVRRGHDVEYHIVGEGEGQASIERVRDAQGLGERVVFHGPKTRTELPAVLNDCDLFLAPSFTDDNGDIEGTPTVLIEAAALGMPAVSTFHSGIPEVVLDGVTGHLAPERDVPALADCIERLIAESDRWPAIGAAARHHVEQNFDERTQVDRLVALYRDLID